MSGDINLKSFVSENELEERRKKRQQEWDKVRRPEDPREAPEEVYDHRSLYERLQEQKEKKEAEWEETHRLKNMVRGLDDDEIGFLDLVDKTKAELEYKKELEERQAISEYRQAVAQLHEKAEDDKLKLDLLKSDSGKISVKEKRQKQLLKNAVKRKSEMKNENKTNKATEVLSDQQVPIITQLVMPSALICCGVLPGLNAYSDSSSSNSIDSSDSNSDEDIASDQLCQQIPAKKTKGMEQQINQE